MLEDDSTTRFATDRDLTGTLVADKYRVLRPLGMGATGTIYLCQHVTLDKPIALKVLHSELARDPGVVARFRREALAAARLDHPHSVRVMDFGQDAFGSLYLAMEYVEGRDLFCVLHEEWPLSDQRIVTIMSQVLSALSAAHALGIVHRDLKPENILLRTPEPDATSDHALVCDFGIAQLSPIRLTGSTSTSASHMRLHAVTQQGTVVGTPAYMSPEQVRAEDQDGRSDVYAAGAVLFQLLTRNPPFVADTPIAIAVMHCSTPPPPPSDFGPVNPRLEAVCLKALGKTPEARFQSAREMRLALEAAIAPEHSEAATIAKPDAQPMAANDALEHRIPAVAPAVRGRAKISQRRSRMLAAAIMLGAAALVSAPRLLRGHREPVLASITPPSAPHPTTAPSVANADRTARVPAPSVENVFQPPSLARVERTQPPAATDDNAEAPTANSPTANSPTANSPTANSPTANSPTANSPTANSPTANSPTANSLTANSPTANSPAAHNTSERTVAALSKRWQRNVSLATRARAAGVTERSVDPAPAATNPAPTPDPKPSATNASDSDKSAAIAAPQEKPPLLAATTHSTSLVSPVLAAPSSAPTTTRSHADPHISIDVTAATAGVSKASVRGALNGSALNRCYHEALQLGTAPRTTTQVRLEFATQDSGRITSASAQGPVSKTLRECIEQVARTGRVREVDTGAAKVSVALTLQPE